MPQSSTTSAATPDVIQDVEPASVKDEMSQAPVLITEQEVAFSTAVALAPRPPSKSRRLIDAIRTAGSRIPAAPAEKAPPAKQQVPRALPHGPRNGPTVTGSADETSSSATGFR